MDSIKTEIKCEPKAEEKKELLESKTDYLNEEKVSTNDHETSSQSFPQDNNCETNSVQRSLNRRCWNSNNSKNVSENSALKKRHSVARNPLSSSKSNESVSMRSICREDKKRQRCPVCHKSFRELKTHLLTHTGEKIFKCLSCGESFSHRTALRRHSFCHSGKKPYTCGTCNRSFIEAYRLKMHLSVHTGVKAYKCSICQKSFAREQHLKKHSRVHTQERPCNCSFCGKSFANKYTLRNHVNVVHKSVSEKLFKCSVCTKSFMCRKYLKRHIVIHNTEEEPFQCAVCSREFAKKNYLVEHIRKIHSRLDTKAIETDRSTKNNGSDTSSESDLGKIITESQEFACFLCSRTFSSMQHLKTHVLLTY